MGITRRDFLRGAGTGAGLAAVVGAEAAPAEARELKTKGGREVLSLCYYCAVGCGIVASVADGSPSRATPSTPSTAGRFAPRPRPTSRCSITRGVWPRSSTGRRGRRLAGEAPRGLGA